MPTISGGASCVMSCFVFDSLEITWSRGNPRNHKRFLALRRSLDKGQRQSYNWALVFEGNTRFASVFTCFLVLSPFRLSETCPRNEWQLLRIRFLFLFFFFLQHNNNNTCRAEPDIISESGPSHVGREHSLSGQRFLVLLLRSAGEILLQKLVQPPCNRDLLLQKPFVKRQEPQ